VTAARVSKEDVRSSTGFFFFFFAAAKQSLPVLARSKASTRRRTLLGIF
jgi:hypothetical protein